MAGVPDSAYFNLFRIVEKNGYDDQGALDAEPAFSSMRAQPRWAMTCGLIDELAVTVGAREEMVTAARHSFHRFATWFDRWDADTGGAPPC